MEETQGKRKGRRPNPEKTIYAFDKAGRFIKEYPTRDSILEDLGIKRAKLTKLILLGHADLKGGTYFSFDPHWKRKVAVESNKYPSDEWVSHPSFKDAEAATGVAVSTIHTHLNLVSKLPPDAEIPLVKLRYKFRKPIK